MLSLSKDEILLFIYIYFSCYFALFSVFCVYRWSDFLCICKNVQTTAVIGKVWEIKKLIFPYRLIQIEKQLPYVLNSNNTDDAFWQHVWEPRAGNEKLVWFCTRPAFDVVVNIKYVPARHHPEDQWTGRERYYFSARFAFWLAPGLNGIEKEWKTWEKRRGCNAQIQMTFWKTYASRRGVWSRPHSPSPAVRAAVILLWELGVALVSSSTRHECLFASHTGPVFR